MIGSKVYYFDKIDSTNAYAKSLLSNTPEGTIIRADRQTEGKGRFGKGWYSPEDGLWMSVILRPANASLITIAAGVAVCDALHMCSIVPSMKWPNDILLNRKKIGGILAEIVESTVILGIGINLNIRKFPPKLAGVASSVYLETKRRLNKETVYNYVCTCLDDCYRLLKTNCTAEILRKWRNYTMMLGQTVTIEQGARTVVGRVLDISNDGSLIIVTADNHVEHINGGVCFLKQDTGIEKDVNQILPVPYPHRS